MSVTVSVKVRRHYDAGMTLHLGYQTYSSINVTQYEV